MTIYVTPIVAVSEIESEWLAWMRKTHIPQVMETGCFLECRISKIQGEEDGGSAYSCLYLAPTSEKLEEYHANHATALQQDHALRFGGKFAAFRTNLTVIEEFKAP